MEIKDTIKVAVTNNMPCLLVGRHGTGKSFAVKEAAEKEGRKLHRIIVTQETTPEDLVFNYELKEGKTKTTKRELLRAVEKGDWVVLEEINMASPAVLTMLNGLLETDPESRYLRYLDKEVKPHENFRLFATSNPTSYSGANRMNDALLSRFIIKKVNPNYAFFLTIIKKDYCTNGAKDPLYKEAKAFVSAVTKIEKNYEMYISPRELLTYTTLRKQGYDKPQALSFVLDRFYDEPNDIIEDLAALFDVEIDREETQVLNAVEIRKLKQDARADVEDELDKLKIEIEPLKRRVKLLEKIEKHLNSNEE